MKVDVEQIEQYLKKITTSTNRTLQANVAQFFQYLYSHISLDNPKYKQYESENKNKWTSWPTEEYWQMPIDVEEARSLSYYLYRSVADNGVDFIFQIYIMNNSLESSITDFHQDFLDHFFQAIQEINNSELGTDIINRKELPLDPSTVFVVHGRNEKLRKSMFDFLRSIGLSPLEWSQLVIMTGQASPFVGEVLEIAFTRAQAVVVLLSPDDDVKLKDEFITIDDSDFEKTIIGQARPNVLFEGGMAMGRHPERTVFVQVGTVKPFSDILGRHTIRMNNNIEKRQDLANRLKSSGCSVNLEGTDWHKSGDFIL